MDMRSWEAAQRSVIGSLLINPNACAGEIFRRAKSSQFSDSTALHVFEAARNLWNDGRAIDPVTLLNAAGGEYADYLAEAASETPTVNNLSLYLDIMRDSAKLHSLQAAAAQILNCNSERAAAEIYDSIGQQLMEREDIEDLSWTELVHDYLDRMADRTPPDYLSWGIPELDKALNVSPGKFIILAADSSVGKTALALQFAYHIASTGKKVGFFSLETDAQSLTDRLMAETQTASVALPKTKQRNLNERDYRNVSDVGRRSGDVPLRIIRNADTVEQIRSRVIMRRFDVIFIDYVQLINGPGQERWNIVTNVSIQLHRMAQQLGVTIVGLSQITPPSKDAKRAPSKDDLRESRQLKHDADVILIMSLSEEGSGMFRELNIAKNKDGGLGRMLLDFDAEHMTFSYRSPPKPNPYTEVAKAARKVAKTKRNNIDGQADFTEYDGAGDGNPF